MKYGIWAKATCYMLPLFLSPFVDKFGDYLLNGIWPSLQLISYCALVGTINTCIGGRAFFDGSAERSKTEDAQILKDMEPIKPEPPKT
jgi:hypothetical protein